MMGCVRYFTRGAIENFLHHQRNYMVGRTRGLFVVYYHEPSAIGTRDQDTHFVFVV